MERRERVFIFILTETIRSWMRIQSGEIWSPINLSLQAREEVQRNTDGEKFSAICRKIKLRESTFEFRWFEVSAEQTV
jgi:hypothetical protein